VVTTTGFPAPSLSEAGILPAGVTLTDNGDGTATLGGTPAAGTTGTYSFTIRASNGVGSNATQAFTLTVNPGSAPSAPAITSGNATAFTVGQQVSFVVTATGFPAPSFSEVGTLPLGVTLLDNGDGTATLSGTPTAGTSGTYSFTIRASNGVGSNATQAFTLTVTTTSLLVGNQTNMEGDSVSLQLGTGVPLDFGKRLG
jgi:hypothetical protein